MTNPNRFAAAIVLGALVHTASGQKPLLVPTPKEVRWRDGPAVDLLPGQVAIVLGESAGPVATTAADLLKRQVARRFGRDWPIIRESGGDGQPSVAVLLGERREHKWLDRLCRERTIALSSSEPGHDGYIIEIVHDGDRTLVIVGGSDARGVLYGQDTLFELLAMREGRLQLIPASIRDRPTVPWRGRPQTAVAHHLQPGMMDTYAIARMNFIDLRAGTYAYDADHKLTDREQEEIAAVIGEAHKRGIVVFATVNCGVPASAHEKVLALFERFIAMGADGIWLSFDDKGPGENPEGLVFDALQMARRHGICGERIAITPPKGSYQTIQTPFNRKIMNVSGMEQALWFFTRLPSAETAEQARSIGLKTLPAWWHNWPRPRSGLTHIEGASTLASGRRAYIELPSIAVGWHEPTYEELADGGRYCQAAMPWGGNAWDPYYVVPVVGWWGWSPENPNWEGQRARIYRIVFGDSAVELAREFDNLLVPLKKLYVYPGSASEWKPIVPPHLKDPAQRDTALALIEKLEALLGRIRDKAVTATSLEEARLRSSLLEPMQAEIATARAAATLAYPEYWWDGHQRQLLEALYAGNMERADALAVAVRQRVIAEAERVGQAMAHLSPAGAYVDWWRARANLDAAGWKSMIQARRKILNARVWEYGFYSVLLSDLLKDIENPPVWWGRGRTDRQIRIVSTALPELREQFRGDWIGGIADKVRHAAVFTIDRRSTCNAGDYSELPVRLPLGGDRRRLGLLVFMNRSTKDAFGLEETRGRWMGHAAVQLLRGEQVLWTGDVGLPREGRPWDLVRLPPIPEDHPAELSLRLRAVCLKDSDGMQAIVFVGPIRLVELPE